MLSHTARLLALRGSMHSRLQRMHHEGWTIDHYHVPCLRSGTGAFDAPKTEAKPEPLDRAFIKGHGGSRCLMFRSGDMLAGTPVQPEAWPPPVLRRRATDGVSQWC